MQRFINLILIAVFLFLYTVLAFIYEILTFWRYFLPRSSRIRQRVEIDLEL